MGKMGGLQKMFSTPKGRLEWYFDFLNLDLDELDTIRAQNIHYGLKAITTSPHLPEDQELERFLKDSQSCRVQSKEVQKLLKETLIDLINSKRSYSSIVGPYIIKHNITYNISLRGPNVFLEAEDPLSLHLLQFLMDLSRYPLDSVKQCERQDCSKYFIRTSAKERRYCCNKCAWIVNARNKRTIKKRADQNEVKKEGN